MQSVRAVREQKRPCSVQEPFERVKYWPGSLTRMRVKATITFQCDLEKYRPRLVDAIMGYAECLNELFARIIRLEKK